MAEALAPQGMDAARFKRSFQKLLARAAQRVAEQIPNAPEDSPWLGDLAFFYLFSEMLEWPETNDSRAAALADPVLRRLTFSVAGVPSPTNFWVNFTLMPAVRRYRELGPPNQLDSARLRLVTGEVIAWATLDIVPVVTITPLFGISLAQAARFKVDEETVIRCLTTEEPPVFPREYIAGGFMMHTETPCLVTTRELPRLQSPEFSIPEPFIKALQVILGVQVAVGPSSVRPKNRPYSPSNQEFIRQRVPDPLTLIERAVTGRELARARRATTAFGDLKQSGFDLALDSYAIAVNSRDVRQRAVNIAIGLENLYLTGIGQELTYRFKLHVVAYGSRLPKSDRVDMRTAGALYDARSAVVHGGTTRSGSEIEDAIDLLNSKGLSLLRMTLLSLISRRNRSHLRNISQAVKRRVTH